MNNTIPQRAGPLICWLDEPAAAGPSCVGFKADRLATLLRTGFPVPRGFCVTAVALRRFLSANGIEAASGAAERRVGVLAGSYPRELRDAVIAGYTRLGSGVVAVRSSALAEDLPAASFAGQQDSFLGIQGEEALLDAIRRCWASVWAERAISYRRERSADACDAIAVIVQEMIQCDRSGVAFSVNPVTGSDDIVIEAAAGPGGVVDGEPIGARCVVARAGEVLSASDPQGLLPGADVRSIAEIAVALERALGCPQDIEWGFAAGKLYLLQTRPVTARGGSFFTERVQDDRELWTSGFLNERFAGPVSPLGWTLIRELLEPLAFRDPLRFLGCRASLGFPLLKLYCGHPFVNVRVFQILYKPFPEWMLPEDARRFFPGSDTSVRLAAAYPCCVADPRMWMALSWHFLHDPWNWSPFHNYRCWRSFTDLHDRCMSALERRFRSLSDDSPVEDAWRVFLQAQALNARLLSIHRWSLSYADLFYTLLRRILVRSMGKERGGAAAARLVTGVRSKSVEANRALHRAAGTGQWDSFIARYGHRSMSLDIVCPTFAEDSAVLRRLEQAAGAVPDLHIPEETGRADRSEVKQKLRSLRWGWVRALVFDLVVRYASRYMTLREEQRFYWQRTLALQRSLALWLGRKLVARRWLHDPADIFFLTLGEIREAVGGNPPAQELPARRKADFRVLKQRYDSDPSGSYPRFLRGIEPVLPASEAPGRSFRGVPVSPGYVRGPARVVASSEEFGRLLPGDILVTRGADPGWTPVFGRLAGLVMEVGGQLSHGAVVAREYGLPAVADIEGAMRLIPDGATITVDGDRGEVQFQ